MLLVLFSVLLVQISYYICNDNLSANNTLYQYNYYDFDDNNNLWIVRDLKAQRPIVTDL